MKKLLALLLCLAMLISLAACGSSKKADSKEDPEEKTETKAESESDTLADPEAEIPSDNEATEETELTPEMLKGIWTAQVNINDMSYAMEGKGIEESFFEEMNVEMSEINTDFDSIFLDLTLEFQDDQNLSLSVNPDELVDFFADFMTDILNYLLSPEYIVAEAGITMEQFEAYLANEGMTKEEYTKTMKDTMESEMGFSLDDSDSLKQTLRNEMFGESDDFTDSGKYTISGNEIIPVFDEKDDDIDEDTEDSEDDVDIEDGKFIYEDGKIIVSLYKDEELVTSFTFEKQ